MLQVTSTIFVTLAKIKIIEMTDQEISKIVFVMMLISCLSKTQFAYHCYQISNKN